jgi:hypothetical protein
MTTTGPDWAATTTRPTVTAYSEVFSQLRVIRMFGGRRTAGAARNGVPAALAAERTRPTNTSHALEPAMTRHVLCR